MDNRVLFVDDDQMLLSSMERCLGLKLKLDTALSGPEALDRMRSTTYSVVVSDMRMPGMDGVQFIDKARQVAKHTVYMMLTGNQDVQTAIRAVNEGQVFRFLTKPCRPEEIAAAIAQAQHQYDLEASERELLNKTFVGALGVFADVVETLQPRLVGRSGKTEQIFDDLRGRCQLPARWEYKVAAKVMLLGFAMQTQQQSGVNVSPTQANMQLNRACTTAARIVQRIPRLDPVAEIIRCVPTTDGALVYAKTDDPSDVILNGAALLRVAHMIEAMVDSGVECPIAMEAIRKTLPCLNDKLATAARDAYPNDIEVEGVPVDIDNLQPGLVLFEDLTGPWGATLLRSGRELSLTHIVKLKEEKASRSKLEPVVVTRASFLVAFPDAVMTQTV
jgi:CheY-like chemotaxis protein